MEYSDHKLCQPVHRLAVDLQVEIVAFCMVYK